MVTILTTHTGSLHRPRSLVPKLHAHEAGVDVPGFDDEVQEAVAAAVADQVRTGIDIVNDGEQGRRAYVTYPLERLDGFEPGLSGPKPPREFDEFPEFAAMSASIESTNTPPPLPACTGPIALRDRQAIQRDISTVAAAASSAGVDPAHVFMSAASPGTIAVFLDNHYYPSKADYLGALADAMRDEYRAVVEAGLILQIDCPDLAMGQGTQHENMTLAEIRQDVTLSVEALNAAVAGLPAEKMRIHLCWGNYESPHTNDVPLADIIDIVATARPAGISVEAANPRHGHEWRVFKEFKLPDDKYLLPGVIDTTTNFVEHPELVAQRIRNYADIVGDERVIASTDCGFGTHAGRVRVASDVAWAKLRSLVEGARLASR